MKRLKTVSAATFALVFLAACGSTGMGDILGGGGSTGARTYEIRGTVDHVDANARSIMLTNVTGANTSMLSSGSGVRVYFDERTDVEYQGRTYRPTDLERGDQVAVQVDESGNQLFAQRMAVLHNVSAGTMTHPTDTYGGSIRGTVRFVDPNRRTIEIDRGMGSPIIVEFDNATPVYFNNRTYRPADLQRGDEIDVRVRDLGSGRYAAQDITVLRSVSGTGTTGPGTGTAASTVRGTVVNVDTVRRTIELESANWISRFNTGTTPGNRVVIQYDNNVSVDVNGRLYPVGNLERGDVIEVQVRNAGATTPIAERIILVRDVNQMR